MKHLLRNVHFFLGLFGLDLLKTIHTTCRLPGFFHNLRTFRKQNKAAGHDFPVTKLYPCLEDRFYESGSGRGAYFHQDLLVARRIFERKPSVHFDVGSRIDGFVAHVATFREINVVDIRPMTSDILNVSFVQADMMKPVPSSLGACCDSISCLHALEHFGLGRYGDPLRFDGHLLGLENLHRMLKPGGLLYLAVPIGPQRIEFDAHRVFSVRYLLSLLAEKYNVMCFSFVDDRGNLHENVPLQAADVENSYGCRYGCGIFELVKRERIS